MLNNITAAQSLDAKNKFEQPNPELVAKEQLNVVRRINEWKENPKDRRTHLEYLRSPSNPNMPDDAFYETLKKQLEEQGYACLLNRKESSTFEVSLPKTKVKSEPVASPAAEAKPPASSTASRVADVPATLFADGYRLATEEEALAYCRRMRDGPGPLPSSETAAKPPAVEFNPPVVPAAEAKAPAQSSDDAASLDKKLSTAASQMANMMKSIYRLLDKNHFKYKGSDGKPDFLTLYTASCVYTMITHGFDMMRPLLNELHAAGRLPMTAVLPPFAAFPNKDDRTCDNKRIVLTVCLSMANQNQTDADVLYLSLNTMYRLLHAVM